MNRALAKSANPEADAKCSSFIVSCQSLSRISRPFSVYINPGYLEVCSLGDYFVRGPFDTYGLIAQSLTKLP